MAAAKPKHGRKYSILVSGLAKQLQATHQKLYYPEKTDADSYINFLKNLVEPLTNGLSKYYENVEIKVVTETPDLSGPQDWGAFKLAGKGLSGNTRLADVGGVPYMNDPKYHHITFQLNDIVKVCGMEKALIIGAAAASPTVVGKNAELMPNTLVPGPRHTQFAKMDTPVKVRQRSSTNENENENETDNDLKLPENGGAASNSSNNSSNADSNDTATTKTTENKQDESKEEKEVPYVGIYPAEETGCLANLFLSDGQAGPTIYLKVSQRKGDKGLNLGQCIREALNDYREKNKIEQQIGMGGVFKLNKGKIKSHIMPDFCNFVLEKKEQVEDWLQFFEMGPELVMLSTLITGDPTQNSSMHLRVEHTHFYSTHKKHCHEGGHYHYDVVKDVEYEGYFNIAEYIYRVEDAQYNIDNEKK